MAGNGRIEGSEKEGQETIIKTKSVLQSPTKARKATIRAITQETARDYIRTKHRTGPNANSASPYNFGLYIFTNKGSVLKGVCTWGYNISGGKTAHTLFGDHSIIYDYLDNLRFYVEKNPFMQASAFLSFNAKMLFKYNPTLKYLLAYGDGLHGMKGIIYQASNWDYIGRVKTDVYYIPKYGLVRTRWMKRYIGSAKLEDVSRVHPTTERLIGWNFRYIRFRDEKTKRDMMKYAKFRIQNDSLPTDDDLILTATNKDNKKYPPKHFKNQQFLPYLEVI